MHDHIDRYFAAEKSESLLFLIVGVVALCLAGVLFRHQGAPRGAAYPLAAVALIQIVVGGTVYFRTDGQVGALRQQLDADPGAFRAVEEARMRVVTRNFRMYKALEIVLIAVGIALASRRGGDVAYGVGLGLFGQASLMLALDLVAERRAALYLDGVRGLAR